MFKNGPSKICERQRVKNLRGVISLQIFKGCLPQILLGPFLNTLPHMMENVEASEAATGVFCKKDDFKDFTNFIGKHR